MLNSHKRSFTTSIPYDHRQCLSAKPNEFLITYQDWHSHFIRTFEMDGSRSFRDFDVSRLRPLQSSNSSRVDFSEMRTMYSLIDQTVKNIHEDFRSTTSVNFGLRRFGYFSWWKEMDISGGCSPRVTWLLTSLFMWHWMSGWHVSPWFVTFVYLMCRLYLDTCHQQIGPCVIFDLCHMSYFMV